MTAQRGGQDCVGQAMAYAAVGHAPSAKRARKTTMLSLFPWESHMQLHPTVLDSATARAVLVGPPSQCFCGPRGSRGVPQTALAEQPRLAVSTLVILLLGFSLGPGVVSAFLAAPRPIGLSHNAAHISASWASKVLCIFGRGW